MGKFLKKKKSAFNEKETSSLWKSVVVLEKDSPEMSGGGRKDKQYRKEKWGTSRKKIVQQEEKGREETDLRI